MSDVEQHIHARLTWVRLYAITQDAGLVCRRCRISRPTLRKWWRRFQAHGEEGLREHSRRPRKTPAPKVTSQYEELILQLRRERNLGAKRIQADTNAPWFGYRALNCSAVNGCVECSSRAALFP